jgi:TolB protein
MRKILAALLLLLATFAQAEVYITVTGANVKRAKLALGTLKSLSGPGDAGAAQKISAQLRDDLEFMNLFDFIEPQLFANLDVGNDIYKLRYPEWVPLQASFVLRVGYRQSGGRTTLEGVLYDVPGEKRILGKTYTFPSDQVSKMVHSLSEEILTAITGEKGLFNTRVLMACAELKRRAPPREIFVSDTDGKNLIQLTSDNTLSLSPSWSPDGRLIAYSQYEFRSVNGKRQKVQALKTHDLRTGKRRVISARKGVNSGAGWSPDGRQIAATLSYTGRPEIYLFDPEGTGNPFPLSRNIQWRKISGGFQTESVNNLLDVEPSWSPDGKKIVLSSARTGHPMIYIVDLGSKQATQLTFAGTYNASPSWSPRGDKILFAAQRLAEGNFDLYMIDTDGNNLSRITAGESRRVNSENPSWAPTGRHFAFANNADGHYGVYISTLDGKVRRRISPTGKDCKNPAWSPVP